MRRSRWLVLAVFLALAASRICGVRALRAHAEETAAPPACAADDGGLVLPDGFCASVFADHVGHARHLVASDDGAVYVNTWSGRYYGNDKPPAGGFLVALRDTTGDGVADEIVRFGDERGAGRDRRHRRSTPRRRALRRGRRPHRALPARRRAPSRRRASPRRSCRTCRRAATTRCTPSSSMRRARSTWTPAPPPTPVRSRTGSRARRATSRARSSRPAPASGATTPPAPDQAFSPAERYATGIRNAVGIALDPGGRVWSTQHGRDQLAENWPALYTPEQGANLPAEELLRIESGADYGWPACYFDDKQQKLVLAPEYGGDGGKAEGACASKRAPVAFFPAHWAPNALLFYTGDAVPGALPRRRVHRLPRLVEPRAVSAGGLQRRLPAARGRPALGQVRGLRRRLRGRGQAAGPGDASPVGARAGRPTARSTSRTTSAARSGACTTPALPSRIARDRSSRPRRPRRRRPRCRPKASTPTPARRLPRSGPSPSAPRRRRHAPDQRGADRARRARVRGEVGGGTCVGCHGADARGTGLGSDLAGARFVWSDGSYASILRLIEDGVPNPKEHTGVMPPRGGAQLSDEQVRAVAAYVYALSRAGAGK